MNLAKYVDHTLLKPGATRAQILSICNEAKENGFASVCVNPVWISTVAQELKGTNVAACVVIGFPLGAVTPEMKAMEASQVVAQGAQEVDMVINVGAVKEGDWNTVEADIRAVKTALAEKAKLKVIIETCLLTDDEKVRVCKIAQKVGADFVKTSTGFSTGGATEEDVRLMRQTVGPNMGVKASGGIRTREDAEKMIAAGANRLGTSAGCSLI